MRGKHHSRHADRGENSLKEERMIFRNRTEAGRKLAQALKKHDFKDPVILGLPRGGVVLASEVARTLHVPVGVVMARKIGAPGHEEYGIGAVSEDETAIFNPEVLSYFDPRSPEIQKIVADETLELQRRIALYREGKSLPSLSGKTAILVDDGIATGVTAAAAGKFVRSLHPERVVLAVPVGPINIGSFVKENFDEIICLHALHNFRGVGTWYEDFNQVVDDEVMKILSRTIPETSKRYE